MTAWPAAKHSDLILLAMSAGAVPKLARSREVERAAWRSGVGMVSRFKAGQPADPRNTYAWRQLRDRVYAEETHCWRCHMWVDQALHKTHPMSRTVDHLVPIARGGEGVPMRSGVRLAHRRCNGRRGHRPDARPTELSIDISKI